MSTVPISAYLSFSLDPFLYWLIWGFIKTQYGHRVNFD